MASGRWFVCIHLVAAQHYENCVSCACRCCCGGWASSCAWTIRTATCSTSPMCCAAVSHARQMWLFSMHFAQLSPAACIVSDKYTKRRVHCGVRGNDLNAKLLQIYMQAGLWCGWR